MNCPNCNREIPADSDSCPFCFADLKKEEYETVIKEAYDDAVEPDEVVQSVDEIIARENPVDGSPDHIDQRDYERLMNEIEQEAVNLDEQATDDDQSDYSSDHGDGRAFDMAANSESAGFENVYSSDSDHDKVDTGGYSDSFDYNDMAEQLSFTPLEKKRRLSPKLLTAIIAAAVVLIAGMVAGGYFALNAMGLVGSGDCVSGEYIVADKKYVYFANPLDDNKLYKYNLKKPSEDAVKLTDESVRYLSIMGNNIYYSAEKNDGLLKAVSVNGDSNKADISTYPAEYVSCADSNIYFSNPGEDGQIYKVSVSGSVEAVKNAKGTHIAPAKGRIYYIYDGVLSYTKTSGENEKVDIAQNVTSFVTNGEDIAAVDKSGNLLYFASVNKKDGQEAVDMEVSGVKEVFLDKKGRKIVYLNQSGAVYEIEVSSKSSQQKLTEGFDRLFYSSKAMAAINSQTGKIFIGSRDMSELDLPATEFSGEIEAPSGNTINQSYAAVDSEYLYYLNYSNSSIMRSKRDGSGEPEIVSGVPGAYLTVDDGWIYYADYSAGGLLYKIKPDGTGSTRITIESVNNVIIYGDWIYYITVNNDLGEYYIRRTTKDGLMTNTVTTGAIGSMTIVDGWIYYAALDAEKNQLSLYRIRTDGQYNEMLVENIRQSICSYDERIYYTDANYKIYSCDLTGGDIRDTGISAQSFLVDDNAIYYSDITTNYLTKADLDSSSSTVLAQTASFGISSCGDVIVFVSYDQASSAFLINSVGKDGTNLKNIG